jgi:zinc protease
LKTLLLALALFGQVETTPPPPAAPRQPEIPTPVEKTLANGVRVLVVEKHGLPLVTERVVIRSGAEEDPPQLAGLADMTASLLTKGTTTRTAKQIAEGVEALGTTLDSGAGFDASFVSIDVLSTNLNAATGFVADVIRHPTFQQEELDRLRDQDIDDLRVAMKQPQTLARMVAQRAIFGTTPYGHNLGGTPESLQRIKREDVVRFHAEHYRPSRAILVFVGEITPAEAFAVAEKHFGDWRGRGGAKATITLKSGEAALPPPRVLVVDMPEAGQAAVLVARVGLRRADPLYPAAQVTNAVLGAGYSSRLNEEIRIKRGLSYGAGSGFEFRREPGPFVAGAQTKNESAAEVAGLVVDEIAKLGKEPVNDVELVPRKASLIGDFARSLETSSGIASRVAGLALYGLSLDEIKRYIPSVQAVTSADVQKFAATHLGGGFTIVIVGDAKQFLDALKKRFPNVEVVPAANAPV